MLSPAFPGLLRMLSVRICVPKTAVIIVIIVMKGRDDGEGVLLWHLLYVDSQEKCIRYWAAHLEKCIFAMVIQRIPCLEV